MATQTDPEPHYSPNRHGVHYGDIEEGRRVRLYSAYTESVVEGEVKSKKIEEWGGKCYAEITVMIDPGYLPGGTASAEEWAELPQIRDVI